MNEIEGRLFRTISMSDSHQCKLYKNTHKNFFINHIREGFPEKKLLFFWILSKLSPPQFEQLVQLFLNAKNVDLSDIQNDSLFKILLKYRRNTCFVCHVYNRLMKFFWISTPTDCMRFPLGKIKLYDFFQIFRPINDLGPRI